jgi:transposase
MKKIKPVVLKPEHTIKKLLQILHKTTDSLERNRIKVLIELKKGKTKSEIALTFQMERGTIIDWVKAYNKSGIKGLKTNKGGRAEGNPVWEDNIFDGLMLEVDKQDQYWSIPEMMQWIKKKYKKDIPEQTVWYRMNKMNDFSCKSSRPRPYLGDKKKQGAFKKKVYQVC